MDEREFELINIIGKELGSNQRDLSRQMDLSLGMINMLIRRLASKGFIRIEQLNKRRVRYILTPKGISEKLRQSVKYTLNTINSFGLIKDNIQKLMQQYYDKGERKFYVFSENDLLLLIENAYREMNDPELELIVLDAVPDRNVDGILILGKEDVDLSGFNADNHINLVEELAQRTIFKENNPGASS